MRESRTSGSVEGLAPQGASLLDQENKNKASGQGLAGLHAIPGDPNSHPSDREGAVDDENGNRSNPNVAVNMG